ncbi:unnamed protein product [Gongylonema pulchrum]|uniref:DNA helicase n=1 Tax=Gongylonema pulchrum TaxID=637853 RepID=A0A183D5A2_9BILA|nr:unnamed protein product [Gongylonema pulchrum]
MLATLIRKAVSTVHETIGESVASVNFMSELFSDPNGSLFGLLMTEIRRKVPNICVISDSTIVRDRADINRDLNIDLTASDEDCDLDESIDSMKGFANRRSVFPVEAVRKQCRDYSYKPRHRKG